MPTLQWTGRSQFSYEGTLYAPGETDEFDDETADELLDHFSDGWERADSDDSDDSNEGDSETTEDAQDGDDSGGDDTEAPFDPAEETNDSLESKLEEGDYSAAELEALLEAEESEKNRDGATSILNEHLDDAEE